MGFTSPGPWKEYYFILFYFILFYFIFKSHMTLLKLQQTSTNQARHQRSSSTTTTHHHCHHCYLHDDNHDGITASQRKNRHDTKEWEMGDIGGSKNGAQDMFISSPWYFFFFFFSFLELRVWPLSFSPPQDHEKGPKQRVSCHFGTMWVFFCFYSCFFLIVNVIYR